MTNVINVSGNFGVDSYAGVGFQENEVATMQASVNGQADPNKGDFQAQIQWGDGQTSQGDLVYTGSSGSFSYFQIKGTHVYAQPNRDVPITVTVTGPGATDSAKTALANIAAMPSGIPGSQPGLAAGSMAPSAVNLNLSGNFGIPSYAGVGFEENEVATFQASVNGKADPNLGDFHAQINWGDSNTWYLGDLVYTGTSGSFSYFQVKGTHTYAQSATNVPIVVYVSGPDGTSTSSLTAYANTNNMPSGIPGTQPAAATKTMAPAAVALDVSGNYSVHATAGVAPPEQEVATFQVSVNGQADGNAGDFRAQINWGDDATWSTGTLANTGASGSFAYFQVSGSHTYAKPNTNIPVVVYVTGPDGTSASALTALATVADNAISLGDLTPTQWTVNQPGYDGTISVKGGTGGYQNLQVSGLPTGLSATILSSVINNQQSGTITISGTPTQSGAFPLHVSLQDGSGQSVGANYTLTITASPMHLGSLAPTQWTVNQPGYDGTITVMGGSGGYQNLQVSGLPNGLSATIVSSVINNQQSGTITISGTPTQSGTFPLHVSLQDGNGQSVSADYTLTITASPMSLGSLTPTQWTVNQPGYDGTITVTGGSGGYRNLQVSGLPNGLNATIMSSVIGNQQSGTITISGTPTQSGTFTLHVSLQDGSGQSVSADYTLTITASPMSLGSLTPTQWTVNQPGYDGTITVTGGSGGYRNLQVSGLPTGLNATIVSSVIGNQQSGTITISGTPTQTGTFTLHVSLQDGGGQSVSGTYTLTITSQPSNPATQLNAVLETGGNSVPENSTVPLDVTLVGGTGMTATGASTPATVTLNGRVVANVNLVNGHGTAQVPAPGQPGSYPVQVTAQPNSSPLLKATVTMNVNAKSEQEESPIPELEKKAGEFIKGVVETLKGLVKQTFKDSTAFEKEAIELFEDLEKKLHLAGKALTFAPVAIDLWSLYNDFQQGNRAQFGKDFNAMVTDGEKAALSLGTSAALSASPLGPIGSLILGSGVDNAVNFGVDQTNKFFNTAPTVMNWGKGIFDSLKGTGTSAVIDGGVENVSGEGDPPPSFIIVSPTTGALANTNIIAAGQEVYAAVGARFNSVVATFTDATGNANPSQYQAYIAWGDGNFTPGTVTALTGGGFSVAGSDTYTALGIYTVTVVIVSSDGSTAASYSGATVYPGGAANSPKATLLAPDVGAENANLLSPYDFRIVYQASSMISAASLAGAAVQVTSPTGQALSAQPIRMQALDSCDVWGDATTIVVTYQIVPPGGTWFAAAPGTYTVSLGGGLPVQDMAGHAVPQSSVRTFQAQVPPVLVVAPLAGVESGTNADISNSKSLTLTGYALANSTVTLFNGGTAVGTTSAAADGSWTFRYQAPSDGTYDFTAVATDALGARSAPSPDDLVQVDTASPTSSVAPLPAESTPSFTVAWSGSDGATGSGIGTYDVYVSDNNGPFTSLLAGTLGTSTTFTGQMGHTYSFYSVATDLPGNAQPTPTAAQASTLVALSNGPTGTITTDTPTFAWNAVADADHYDLWVNDQTSGQSQVVRLPQVTGTSVTLTASQALTPGHSFVWWAGAVNAQGETSWGDSTYFSIAVLAAPTPTGTGAVSGTIPTTVPTFSWNSVAMAAAYEVWLADQTTGQTIMPKVTGTSWTPTQLLNVGDQYTWWVGAMSANGTIAWDNALSFTIAPVGKGPSSVIATNLPIFTWTGVAGVTSYEVWLTDTTTGQTLTPRVAGTSWTPSQSLNLGDQYTWWAGAIKGSGTIAWDAALSFHIAPVGSGPSGVIGSNVPTFNWTGVAGVTTYEIWMTDTTTGQTATPMITGNSWTPSQPLDLGHPYTWWVGAIGSEGIAWDNPLSFTISVSV